MALKPIAFTAKDDLRHSPACQWINEIPRGYITCCGMMGELKRKETNGLTENNMQWVSIAAIISSKIAGKHMQEAGKERKVNETGIK